MAKKQWPFLFFLPLKYTLPYRMGKCDTFCVDCGIFFPLFHSLKKTLASEAQQVATSSALGGERPSFFPTLIVSQS
jgi:hypothetical protein